MITIISVYHNEQSRDLLEKNFDLIKEKNPDFPIKWFAVDNSVGKAKIDTSKFEVLEGVAHEKTNYTVDDSLHVARAYHIAMRAVSSEIPKSGIILILDPDYFLPRKNALKEVMNYMIANRIIFFGVGSHPKSGKKDIDFPMYDCLFIDAMRVNILEFDFTPDKINRLKRFINKNFFKKLNIRIKKIRSTGPKHYRKFRNFKSEVLLPVIDSVDLDEKVYWKNELFGSHKKAGSRLTEKERLALNEKRLREWQNEKYKGNKL